MQRLLVYAIFLMAFALFGVATDSVTDPVASLEYHSTPPTAIGSHVCSGYPRSALESQAQGAVSISFLVEPNGTTQSVTVVDTSGSEALDAWALGCVSSWHYMPATVNGETVEVPWFSRIVFSMRPPGGPQAAYGWPVSVGAPHTCLLKDYPSDAATACAEGIASLSFQILTDSSVKDVAVVKSTGNPDLDQASVKCVSDWRYAPWKPESGEADSFPWKGKAVWRLPTNLCKAKVDASAKMH